MNYDLYRKSTLCLPYIVTKFPFLASVHISYVYNSFNTCKTSIYPRSKRELNLKEFHSEIVHAKTSIQISSLSWPESWPESNLKYSLSPIPHATPHLPWYMMCPLSHWLHFQYSIVYLQYFEKNLIRQLLNLDTYNLRDVVKLYMYLSCCKPSF